MSPIKQFLTFSNSKALPMATHRDIWCITVKEIFWKIADADHMEAHPPFEQPFNSSSENILLHTRLALWITKRVRASLSVLSQS